MRASGNLSRRRKKYKSSYGHGISRVPRKIMTARGSRFFWVGAVAPGTVGGRKAHAPKATKCVIKLINATEQAKAMRSALSATVDSKIVQARGHKTPEAYPFILSDDFEKIQKTKDLRNAFLSLKIGDELERASQRSVRAGKGKMRGRKYKTRKGPLVVVSQDCELLRLQNIPGVEVVKVDELNAELLAPGTNPGRMTFFTGSALKKVGGMFK